MKVKSLLLAGLAAFALASCSNNDEIIDNGIQGEKTAQMQFGIEFPKSINTRAEADTEIGTTAEYEFSKIAVVIFANGNKSVLTFNRDAFTDKSVAGSNNKLFLKESISVEAGVSKLYAFVNPTEALMGSLNSAATEVALTALKESAGYGTTLDALEDANKIAKDNSFLMSNVGGTAVSETFGAEATTNVTIPVERVAAKMEEKSQTTAFTVTTEPSKPVGGTSLAITLGQYTFVNLATETSVLYNVNFSTGDYFQEVGSFGTTTWADFKSKAITGVNNEQIGDITYTMENIGGNAIPTRIMYEASASWDGQAAKTFYILADGTVYLSFAELQANVNISGLTEESSIVEFAAKGIKKYEDGKCYYGVDIKTGEEAKIVRNNVYKLKVTSIAKIGTTTPSKDPDPTSINLTVDMKAWTVNTQENIELK